MALRDDRRRFGECLRELRLPGARGCFQEAAEKARKESLSYETFLLDVMEQERQQRRHHRTKRALKASKLPLEKPLDTFDRKRLPRKVDAHLNVLIEGTFLDRTENVLAFGQPGSGDRKSVVEGK